MKRGAGSSGAEASRRLHEKTEWRRTSTSSIRKGIVCRKCHTKRRSRERKESMEELFGVKTWARTEQLRDVQERMLAQRNAVEERVKNLAGAEELESCCGIIGT